MSQPAVWDYTVSKEITIVRAEHSSANPYFMMARETAQDERLSFEARGMLAYLLSKADGWKILVSDLCQQCGRTRVYRILNELKAAKYIEYERKSGGRGKWEHIYKVHEISRVDFTDVKSTDVKVTHLKNPEILDSTESLENTDSRKEEKKEKAAERKPKHTPIKDDPHAAIFSLYEKSFGYLVNGQMLKETLLDMAKEYPLDWLADAFKEAALSNAKNIKYVQAILDRWLREGKSIKTYTGTATRKDPDAYERVPDDQLASPEQLAETATLMQSLLAKFGGGK